MWLQSSFWSLNLQLDNLTKWWLEVARRSQWRKRCLAPFQPVNLTKRADRHMGPLADLWLCRKDPCAWHDTSLFQCLKCMKCIPVLCFKLSQVQNLRSVSHCAFFESFRMANSDTGSNIFYAIFLWIVEDWASWGNFFLLEFGFNSMSSERLAAAATEAPEAPGLWISKHAGIPTYPWCIIIIISQGCSGWSGCSQLWIIATRVIICDNLI